MSEQNVVVADVAFVIPDSQRSKLAAVVGSSLIGTAIELPDHGFANRQQQII
jgi:hypothetical protein